MNIFIQAIVKIIGILFGCAIGVFIGEWILKLAKNLSKTSKQEDVWIVVLAVIALIIVISLGAFLICII